MSSQQPPLVPRELEGRLAIITGGSRGIGAAIAENLASKGCSLVLNYTSPSSTARTTDLCNTLSSKHSVRCVSVQADLEDAEASVSRIVASTKEHFPKSSLSGEFTIDILINNAGIAEHALLNDPEKGPITPALFHRQNTINVLAPLLLTQAVAPHLPRDRSGRIVNLSSVSAPLGLKTQSVYVGTKAALEGMTRTWARELADRATVNAINPGPVVGDMYWAAGEDFWKDMQGWQDNAPLSRIDVEKEFEAGTKAERLDEETRKIVKEKMGGRRPAFTDEIAGVVGMLCGKDGGWCTGSVVCANGGLRMSV